MKTLPKPLRRKKVQRISISLSESVFAQLDCFVEQRGLENRSKAISEMITQSVLQSEQVRGDSIMAGTIVLVYDESHGRLLSKLAHLQRQHVAEVISSLHVQLQDQHRMEVVLVQGPAHALQAIANKLFSCKGVKTGKLTLSSMILPPLHYPGR